MSGHAPPAEFVQVKDAAGVPQYVKLLYAKDGDPEEVAAWLAQDRMALLKRAREERREREA